MEAFGFNRGSLWMAKLFGSEFDSEEEGEDVEAEEMLGQFSHDHDDKDIDNNSANSSLEEFSCLELAVDSLETVALECLDFVVEQAFLDSVVDEIGAELVACCVVYVGQDLLEAGVLHLLTGCCRGVAREAPLLEAVCQAWYRDCLQEACLEVLVEQVTHRLARVLAESDLGESPGRAVRDRDAMLNWAARRFNRALEPERIRAAAAAAAVATASTNASTMSKGVGAAACNSVIIVDAIVDAFFNYVVRTVAQAKSAAASWENEEEEEEEEKARTRVRFEARADDGGLWYGGGCWLLSLLQTVRSAFLRVLRSHRDCQTRRCFLPGLPLLSAHREQQMTVTERRNPTGQFQCRGAAAPASFRPTSSATISWPSSLSSSDWQQRLAQRQLQQRHHQSQQWQPQSRATQRQHRRQLERISELPSAASSHLRRSLQPLSAKASSATTESALVVPCALWESAKPQSWPEVSTEKAASVTCCESRIFATAATVATTATENTAILFGSDSSVLSTSATMVNAEASLARYASIWLSRPLVGIGSQLAFSRVYPDATVAAVVVDAASAEPEPSVVGITNADYSFNAVSIRVAASLSGVSSSGAESANRLAEFTLSQTPLAAPRLLQFGHHLDNGDKGEKDKSSRKSSSRRLLLRPALRRRCLTACNDAGVLQLLDVGEQLAALVLRYPPVTMHAVMGDGGVGEASVSALAGYSCILHPGVRPSSSHCCQLWWLSRSPQTGEVRRELVRLARATLRLAPLVVFSLSPTTGASSILTTFIDKLNIRSVVPAASTPACLRRCFRGLDVDAEARASAFSRSVETPRRALFRVVEESHSFHCWSTREWRRAKPSAVGGLRASSTLATPRLRLAWTLEVAAAAATRLFGNDNDADSCRCVVCRAVGGAAGFLTALLNAELHVLAVEKAVFTTDAGGVLECRLAPSHHGDEDDAAVFARACLATTTTVAAKTPDEEETTAIDEADEAEAEEKLAAVFTWIQSISSDVFKPTLCGAFSSLELTSSGNCCSTFARSPMPLKSPGGVPGGHSSRRRRRRSQSAGQPLFVSEYSLPSNEFLWPRHYGVGRPS